MGGAILFTLLPLACYSHAGEVLRCGEIRARKVSEKESSEGQRQ